MTYAKPVASPNSPKSAIITGVLKEGSAMARLLYAVERGACRTADMMNVLTPAFREDLLRRDLAPGDKIVLVPNGVDLELRNWPDLLIATAGDGPERARLDAAVRARGLGGTSA